MFQEPEHSHTEKQQTQTNKRKKVKQFNCETEVKQFFAQTLSKSQSRLNETSIQELKKRRQLRQKRIYAGMDISELQYLFIMFEDRRINMGLELEQMETILKKKNNNIVKDLIKEKLVIQKGNKPIKDIRKQLDLSLDLMKVHSPQGSLSSEGRRSSKGNILSKSKDIRQQFSKRSYWKTPNQKTESVQKFIKSMKDQQIQQRKRRRQKRKRIESQNKLSEESRLEKKQEQNKKLKEQLHNEFLKKRQQNEKEKLQKKKKQDEIQEFLKKFKQKPPNYIVFSERYKKKEVEEEKERRLFLKQLKDARRHNSLSEMREQMRKYEELKQMHSIERQQERKLQGQITEEIQYKLRDLYRSKIYSRSLREKPPPIDPKVEKKKQMLKMIMYSKKAQMEHTPQINEEKRFELIKDISELKKKQDHNKIIKIRNGEQIVINKNKLDPRKIGLQYLEEVKQITSHIERKPPPTPPVKEQKILDRSLLKTSFYNKKITITNWKQVVENKNLTYEEKEEKLKQYFDMVQEKQLSSQIESKKAGRERSIDLQKMTDHYEIQKTAAKLALLKSLK